MIAKREPGPESIEAAAGWLALMHSEDFDDQAVRQLQDWRQASAENELAFQRMQAFWGRFDHVPAQPAHQALRRALGGDGYKRRNVTLALLLGATGLSLGWWGRQALPAWTAQYHTATGQRQEWRLADQTRLVLNTASAVDVTFDDRQRILYLHQGELWVDVASDAQRPFRVQTRHGQVTALGTQFSVRDDGRRTWLGVQESAVSVTAQDSVEARRVMAGYQTTLDRSAVAEPYPLPADSQAWTRGLLKADDQPLVEVLQTLRRHYLGILRFDEQALQPLRVSGVFRLDDPQSALAALEAGLPLHIRHYGPWLTQVSLKR